MHLYSDKMLYLWANYYLHSDMPFLSQRHAFSRLAICLLMVL